MEELFGVIKVISVTPGITYCLHAVDLSKVMLADWRPVVRAFVGCAPTRCLRPDSEGRSRRIRNGHMEDGFVGDLNFIEGDQSWGSSQVSDEPTTSASNEGASNSWHCGYFVCVVFASSKVGDLSANGARLGATIRANRISNGGFKRFVPVSHKRNQRVTVIHRTDPVLLSVDALRVESPPIRTCPIATNTGSSPFEELVDSTIPIKPRRRTT